MQFQNNVVSEITVPNNVPFQPGNNVLGIGLELPPEMITAGYQAGMIFYNSLYSPTATEARIIYNFIACGTIADPNYQSAISLGYVWQANPSANSTKFVATCLTAGGVAPTSSGYSQILSVMSLASSLGAGEPVLFAANDTAGNGVFELFNNGQTHSASKNVGATTPSTAWVVT